MTTLNIKDNDELRRMYYTLRKWQCMGSNDGEMVRLIKRSIRNYNNNQREISRFELNSIELDHVNGEIWQVSGVLPKAKTRAQAEQAYFNSQFDEHHTIVGRVFQRSDGKFKYIQKVASYNLNGWG